MKRLPIECGLARVALLLCSFVAAWTAVAAPPEIRIDVPSTTVRVTPGTTIAYFAADRVVAVGRAIVTDDDRDGQIVLPHPVLRAVIVVDLESGEYAVAGVPLTDGFPSEFSLLPGTDGTYTEVVIPNEQPFAFWVRPTGGAWTPNYSRVADLDGVQVNELTVASLTAFVPLPPTAPPANVQPGDLLFVITAESPLGPFAAYGGVVDPLLAAPRAPGTISMVPTRHPNSFMDWVPEGQPIPVRLLRRGGSEGTLQVRCCAVGSFTAVAGVDYTPVDQVVTFAPGQLLAKVNVLTTNDAVWTGHRDVMVRIDEVEGGPMPAEPRTYTYSIRDDETAPALTLSAPETVVEGNATTLVPITITISGTPRGRPVRVAYGIGTPTDEVLFEPHESQKQVVIPIAGNVLPQNDYAIDIAARLIGAEAPAATKQVTIVDDDLPTLTIADVTVREGADAELTVRIEPQLIRRPTFAWRTVDGTATAGADYFAASGVFDGITPGRITIRTVRDETPEDEVEVFYVELSELGNALATRTRIAVTILDDDDVPQPVFENLRAVETNVTRSVDVRLVLPRPRLIPWTFQITATPGTAQQLTDYLLNFPSVTFQPGQTVQTFALHIVGDDARESTETFTLGLYQTNIRATFTIDDDDSDIRPLVSIDDATVTETTDGTTQWRTRVALSAAAPQPVSVRYATRPATANAGTDYVASTGVLRFETGEFLKEVAIDVTGDRQMEPDEVFLVTLDEPAGLRIGRGEATATIVDDDRQTSTEPLLHFDGGIVAEHAQTLARSLRLTRPATRPVTARITARSATAIAGRDFRETSVVLTIPAGSTAAGFVIAIENDSQAEGTETFLLELTDVDGAGVVNATATVLIVDDDGEPEQSPRNRGVRH